MRRRLVKLGVATVVGQAAFRALIVPALQRRSVDRSAEILRSASLRDAPIPPERVHRVPSVNDPGTAELLASLGPEVVVVNGTRIIARSVLDRCRVPFINMHAGITPAYRGVHGGYWALQQGQPDRCGVTVHRIDEGIDTGPVIAQATIAPTPADNFTTYQCLQWAVGVPLLVEAVGRALDGTLTTRPSEGPSRLWSHPTAWQYLWHRWRRGVR
jgi:methionyl-tRNA formyltransferase